MGKPETRGPATTSRYRNNPGNWSKIHTPAVLHSYWTKHSRAPQQPGKNADKVGNPYNNGRKTPSLIKDEHTLLSVFKFIVFIGWGERGTDLYN
jgi:hypothetical protein